MVKRKNDYGAARTQAEREMSSKNMGGLMRLNYMIGGEAKQLEALLGFAAERKMAADQAVETARAELFEGLGSITGGVGGLFAKGGDFYGKSLSEIFPKQEG